MKHLLVNGCSYAVWWKNSEQLAHRLGAEKHCNLGINASSNDRIFRSTMNYVMANPDVDFVIIMLSFMIRLEAPWSHEYLPYEGRWVSYNVNGIIGETKNDRMPHCKNYDQIQKYIQDRFVIDMSFRGSEYTEKILLNLIALTGWLESRSIKYCVFNTAEDHVQHMIKTEQINQNILNEIRKNKKIIDIDNFMSNQYMIDQGAQVNTAELLNNSDMRPLWTHFGPDGYEKLNEFLYNYITEHCL